MSAFSSHSKKIKDNLDTILTKGIPTIDKSLVFISDSFLYNKLKDSKLYITRGLHFGGIEDALHFNIKIVGYDTEFHVYVGLDFQLDHYPFMLLFITDTDHTIPKIYEYLKYLGYDQYLLFNTFEQYKKIDNINMIIKYYEDFIFKNQQLYKKYHNSAFREKEEKHEEKKH